MTLSNEQVLDIEEEFRQLLLQRLPPIIARKNVEVLLGGVIAAKTLANADSRGDGPIGAMTIGRNVAYPTTALIDWIIARMGVTRIKQFSEL